MVREAFDLADNWHGVQDPRVRKKIQNRLSQRARRRRQDPSKWTPLRSRIDDVQAGHQRAARSQIRNALVDPRLMTRISSDHLLLHLIQFNVFRAILSNVVAMGMQSSFFSCSLGVLLDPQFLPPRLRTLTPPSLEPTYLQRTVGHAPWMDIFPLPAMRDNIIRKAGDFDEHDLCIDVLGTMTLKGPSPTSGSTANAKDNDRSGIIVWADPWRVDSWEITEGFARKWGWMIRTGCGSLLSSTNSWRRVRGEEEINWAKWNFETY